jgi:hypothetical protein
MPLWLLLIPYAIFLAVFGVFSLVDVLNAWRFRSGAISASFLILVFLAGIAIIFAATYFVLGGVDWAQRIGPDLAPALAL